MSVLKLRDADTGVGTIEISEDHRGLTVWVTQNDEVDGVNVVLDRQGEDELFNFLARRRPKPMEFHY